ncbi:TPA: hypothetical protein DDW35_08100 [Candidatus Sumerlaeota bacterium]|nr:hypothetical protein [Candidatus Sumerlaeota bacterium]
MLASIWKKVCVVASLALASTGAFAADPTSISPTGTVGLGTWSTQAEYKEIKVAGADGKVIYEAAAPKDMKDWATENGKWAVKDGAITQTGEENPALVLLDKEIPAEYVLTLKARKTGGSEGFLILFKAKSFGDRAWWNIGGWGNTQHALEGAGFTPDATKQEGTVDDNKWYDLKLEVKADVTRCSIDGKVIHEIKAMKNTVGVGSWNTQVEYKDIEVVGADGKSVFKSGEIKDMTGWKTFGGDWAAQGGVLAQTGGASPAALLLDKEIPADCTMTLKARKTGGEEGFLILFKAKGIAERIWWNVAGWGNTKSALEGQGVPGDDQEIKVENNKWYDLKVELKGKQIRCSMDGKVIHDVTQE